MKRNTQAATPKNTTTKTFQYKILRPRKQFIAACERTLDDARFVYNCALEQRISLYRQTGKGISFYEQSRQLTEARNELPRVKACLRTIQADALERLDEAFTAFFKRAAKGQAGFPRFKSRDRYHTFSQKIEAQRGCPLKGDRLTVPGVGSCRVRLSRPLEGTVKQLRITRRADGWFALLVCEMPKPKALPKTGQSVGVDVGIKEFATLSTGETIANPRHLQHAANKLTKLQRRLSKKKKGSANRKKARQKVALAHGKVASTRKDFHHKEAKKLVDRFDRIAVEELKVANMVRNHRLAKSILDVAWSQFFSITKAKAESAGRLFEKVPAAYTSQDCSRCGHRQKMPLKIRVYECGGCQVVIDRDHNAALNIEIRGSATKFTPAELDNSPTLKQEQVPNERLKRAAGRRELPLSRA
jgi:putative transposase